MGTHSHILAIDIGGGSLKMGEFTLGKAGQLNLVRYAIEDVPLDPHKEEDPVPAIKEALKKALTSSGIKAKHCCFSIPVHSAFLKFVKLPPVDPSQVRQIITFEAQQNVPFPMEEVVWDHQFLAKRSADQDLEALLVAVKKDAIEAQVNALKQGTLEPHLVDIAPLALYNSYVYNYQQSDDCVLLLDIGAKATNLIFIEKGNFFTRSVPIAGNLVSQNICNEFQQPFLSIEMLKKQKGYVALGSEYADSEDEEAARMSRIIRTTLGRLLQEITRSISFYRTQQRGTAPKRVLIVGGASQMPYLDLYLSDKLALPVEYFNPLQNVNVLPTVNRSQLGLQALQLGEVVGLASRAAASCPIEIDLAPPSIEEALEVNKRKPYLIASVVCWMLLMICPFVGVSVQKSVIQAEIMYREDKKNKIAVYKSEIEKLESEADVAEKLFEQADRIQRQRTSWVTMLHELNQKIPQDVWITQISPMFRDSKGATRSLVDDLTVDVTAMGRPTVAKPPKKEPSSNSSGEPKIALEVNQLALKGLFKTPERDATVINQFVRDLEPTTWYDVDLSKVSEYIVRTEAPQEGNPVLALTFDMKLNLKKGLDIRP